MYGLTQKCLIKLRIANTSLIAHKPIKDNPKEQRRRIEFHQKDFKN